MNLPFLRFPPALLPVAGGLLLQGGALMAQGGGLPEPEACPEAVAFFAPLVFPKVLQDGARLRDLLTGEEFASARRTLGDRGSVDLLFRHALRLSWGNVYEALFLCLVVTLDHHRLPVRIPLLGLPVALPLSPEEESGFRRRVAALPTRLYEDSPRTPAGDRDKLQHFFGSAFAAWVTESAEAADRLGFFIEWGEDRMVEGERYDARDVRANRDGQSFALALRSDRRALPSEHLGRAVARTPAREEESP
ncbi:MAG: hypothetical protein WB626_02625 [Bacteroidota bacterium]